MNTSANSQTLVAEYLSRKILERVEPELQVHKLGMEAQIPQGESKTVRWVRYGSIAANLTPLSEGVTPAETAITTSDVQTIVDQYGAWANVTDVLKDTSRFDNMNQARNILSDSAKKTIEQLCINEIDAEGFELLVNNRATPDDIVAADVLELEDFLCAVQLQKNDFLDPHSNGQYAAVVNTACIYDLHTDTNGLSFYDILKQTESGKKDLIKGDLGSLYGIRFLEGDLMTSTPNTGSVNVKNSYVLAYEAFGTVDIKSQGIKIMMTDGKPSDSDPLAQRHKVGYKFYYKPKYLEAGSKRAVVIKSAATKG